MAAKFKVGDRVRLTPEGRRRLGGNGSFPDKVFIVEMSHQSKEGPCVYSESRRGWVHHGLGLNECFEPASAFRRGGE